MCPEPKSLERRIPALLCPPERLRERRRQSLTLAAAQAPAGSPQALALQPEEGVPGHVWSPGSSGL